MVLQFIVSYCCDYGRQNEKSFLTLRSEKQEEKELFISTNDSAILYLPSVVIFELFSLFSFSAPFIHHLRSCSLTKQRKQIKNPAVLCSQQKLTDNKSEIKHDKSIRRVVTWNALKAFFTTSPNFEMSKTKEK